MLIRFILVKHVILQPPAIVKLARSAGYSSFDTVKKFNATVDGYRYFTA